MFVLFFTADLFAQTALQKKFSAFRDSVYRLPQRPASPDNMEAYMLLYKTHSAVSPEHPEVARGDSTEIPGWHCKDPAASRSFRHFGDYLVTEEQWPTGGYEATHCYYVKKPPQRFTDSLNSAIRLLQPEIQRTRAEYDSLDKLYQACRPGDQKQALREQLRDKGDQVNALYAQIGRARHALDSISRAGVNALNEELHFRTKKKTIDSAARYTLLYTRHYTRRGYHHAPEDDLELWQFGGSDTTQLSGKTIADSAATACPQGKPCLVVYEDYGDYLVVGAHSYYASGMQYQHNTWSYYRKED